MRVLVVGSGGREHALAWKIRQSPKVTELYAAPGNAGMAELADLVPIDASSVIELADFARSLNIDLTVVGPELPLTLGIVDEFVNRGLRIVGPSQAAAELEGSKVFSKRFMAEHGIPTAAFEIAHSHAEATSILKAGRFGWPVVVKVDGLAAGKGVVIAQDMAEAEAALVEIFDEKIFGRAGDKVVIEEALTGTEVSFHVVTDGELLVPLASAQDYKRALDGGLGPNTGGMGTVSPSPILSAELQRTILQDAVVPTLDGLRAENRRYRGILYVGLMLTPDGPKVLEYNCRLGDPETQVIVTRLKGDIVPLLEAVADGSLADVRPAWAHHASVCVVMAAKGYPARPETGQPIAGLADAADREGVAVFHAGTKKDGGTVVTAGGRVLGVTAWATRLSEARFRAYDVVSKISFEGAQYRTDIAADVIEFLSRRP